MKQVVLFLLLAFAFSSCGAPSIQQQAQSAAGGIWQAEILGGAGAESGFSFTTEFTLNTNGVLTITYFQFLNSTKCFPVDGGTENGSMALNTNESTGQTFGAFKYNVQASGNTLTLTGNVTGTEVDGQPPLTSGSITGNWSLKGGSGCNDSNGTFTMMQSTSTSTSTSSSGST